MRTAQDGQLEGTVTGFSQWRNLGCADRTGWPIGGDGQWVSVSGRNLGCADRTGRPIGGDGHWVRSVV